MSYSGVARFIAVHCDDDVCRIHDSETGDWCNIEFHGPNAFDTCWGCARKWNEMLAERDRLMEEWFKL